MTSIKIAVRAFLFLCIISVYIACGFVCRLIYRSEVKRRSYYVYANHVACTVCFVLMNIKLKVTNLPNKEKTYLLAGNHMGMLDILLVAHTMPSLFVTSVEMRETPVLGLLTEIAGCIFVERRDRSGILKEMQKLKDALVQGFDVVLFPEGAATNGSSVLPFKRSLMSAAAGTGIPILPFVINYRKVNGEPMSLKWRDFICWYGDTTFVQAFTRVLSLKSIEAEISFLEEVHVESKEQKHEIAVLVHSQVAANFNPIV